MTAYSFEIQEAIPSKKNQMEVKWNPRAFRAVVQILQHFPKPWFWVSPKKAVGEAEELIAWKAKGSIKKELAGEVKCSIWIQGKRQDIDNVVGAVFDGLEQSGRIKNDRQIEELHVYRHGPGVGIRVEVQEVTS